MLHDTDWNKGRPDRREAPHSASLREMARYGVAAGERRTWQRDQCRTAVSDAIAYAKNAANGGRTTSALCSRMMADVDGRTMAKAGQDTDVWCSATVYNITGGAGLVFV